MKTPFLGLRTCIYRVSDLAAAIEWYSKLLGIPPYFNEPFYVGFEVGGFELGLQPPENGISSPGENVETYWGVENVDDVFAALLAAGATAHQEPNEVGGGIKVATAKDPWGNLVGIIFNPHFKAL